MPVTVSVADSSFARPLEVLRHTLANSATFQSVVGAEDADEAKAKILYFWADDEDEAQQQPRAIVRGVNEDEAAKVSTTGYEFTGPMVVVFEFPIPEAYLDNHQDAGLDFLNKLGAIRGEMIALSRTSPHLYLDFQTIGLIAHGEGDEKHHNGDRYWGGEFLVRWNGG
jgi:hypothetical protein